VWEVISIPKKLIKDNNFVVVDFETASFEE
jgi:hypothetical protein